MIGKRCLGERGLKGLEEEGKSHSKATLAVSHSDDSHPGVYVVPIVFEMQSERREDASAAGKALHPREARLLFSRPHDVAASFLPLLALISLHIISQDIGIST